MIKKDKKAIMVKFLTTLLLAIIIFAPACLFASKFFRLSTQAANNYGNFVSEIDDLMRNGGEGEKRIFLLVMDEETSIVYFESNDFKRRELSSWGGP
ncbi:MAG: hypothetical protein KKD75_00620, partial [Nanoarchaeota archaeon]|nr:hypothetical protein [Nanoarchaeota archaeon]MBU1876586.1 hypothetical protein [Nanoarchaeota archaeon]